MRKIPSYDYRCKNEECNHEDFELRPAANKDKPGKCEKCGGETEFFLSSDTLGCIRIVDSKMWPNPETGQLQKLTRTREIQQGRQSDVGRIKPEELHIDRIRQRIKEGKVKVD